MDNVSEARVLVEGGPVHRRINRVLALIIGGLIGILPVLGWIGVEAYTASHDAHEAIVEVKNSRRNSVLLSCEESNSRHHHALIGLEILVAKQGKPNPTAIEKKTNQAIVIAFVEALAPKYNCALRVRELTKP
jgi:hypothetical protein